jgi:hypothetical protein
MQPGVKMSFALGCDLNKIDAASLTKVGLEICGTVEAG